MNKKKEVYVIDNDMIDKFNVCIDRVNVLSDKVEELNEKVNEVIERVNVFENCMLQNSEYISYISNVRDMIDEKKVEILYKDGEPINEIAKKFDNCPVSAIRDIIKEIEQRRREENV